MGFPKELPIDIGSSCGFLSWATFLIQFRALQTISCTSCIVLRHLYISRLLYDERSAIRAMYLTRERKKERKEGRKGRQAGRQAGRS